MVEQILHLSVSAVISSLSVLMNSEHNFGW